MWQTLNWDLWWDTDASQNPRDPKAKPKKIEPDAWEKDDLKPFRRFDGKTQYWNSDDCRDWTKLGYQYDDLVPDAASLKPDGYLNEDHYTTDILARVNRTYPGPAHVISKIRSTDGIDIPDGLDETIGEPFDDYVINVIYDRYALGGTSYSIKFYLGGPENQKTTHFVGENYIGQVFTFTGSFSETEGGCQNCKRQAKDKVLSVDQIPITIPLLNHIFDASKEHPIENLDQVAEYLKLHLSWEFVQHGGHCVNPDRFPNTVISVLKGVGEPQYTKPEKKKQADMVSIAMMTDAALDTLPSNPVADLSEKTINSPDSRALPPIYSNYKPVFAATHGKKYGLSKPSE
jgi:tyrosinase